jgi:hypothetical protein
MTSKMIQSSSTDGLTFRHQKDGRWLQFTTRLAYGIAKFRLDQQWR